MDQFALDFLANPDEPDIPEEEELGRDLDRDYEQSRDHDHRDRDSRDGNQQADPGAAKSESGPKRRGIKHFFKTASMQDMLLEK